MSLSEEQNMEKTNCILDQALDFVRPDDSEFEELCSDSDYEDDIFRKNKNKSNGDQSDLDEEDDIPLNRNQQINLLLPKFLKILK